jgi:hypothetical protein
VTTVDICNLALAMLGEDRITSLEDESSVAELCSVNWAGARDFVLAARPWSFAIVRRSLAAAAEAPEWGPSNAFPLPSSVLRVLSAGDGTYELEDWRVEGRQVVATFDGPVMVRCIERVEDPGQFSPGFEQALAAYLAYVIAVPLTENRSLKSELWSEYLNRMKEAAAVDGQQGRAGQIFSTWARSARG